MRRIFLAVILVGALLYTFIAFSDLNFMTRTGRAGPGFFPRLIGLLAIATTLWALIDDILKTKNNGAEFVLHASKDVVKVMVLAIGYAVLLRLLGGFVATVIFLGLSLMTLNPAQRTKNFFLALIIPTSIYLLFDRGLNANMPPSLIPLPF